MRRALEDLARALGPLARRDVALGPLTTYRVGGPAALFVEARSEADLVAVRDALARAPAPVLVVGKGSNLLVADAGFAGLALRLAPSPPSAFLDFEVAADPGDPGALRVGAGAALGLPVLARRAVEAGARGLEWAVGVPGSVGGALRMNAGGHGSDVAACLRRYRWVDLLGAEGMVESPPERLAPAYRRSSLTEAQVVVWAEFAARAGDRDEGRAELGQIVRWRRAHQPGGSNAGSVFTTPPGASAGALVEEVGLKGMRLGSATVSTKHANFIQADEGGSADDVMALIHRVAALVAEARGVRLETEVRLIGFEEPLDQ